MAIKTIDALVDGGKATAGPPLGPSLAPLKMNIGEIVAAINEKTKAFAGMKVPIKVLVDTEEKTYDIEIGSPPVSQLIKKEVKLEKLAKHAGSEHVADLKMEQAIKIALMKEEVLLSKDRKNMVKSIVGTCLSGGVLVEGKDPREAIKDIDAGKYDDIIRSGKTELSAEELKALEEEKKKLAAEIEEKRHEYEALAKKIIAEMEGKERKEIEKRLITEKIPGEIIKDVMPREVAPSDKKK
ncbi:MAG: 50S ribosomal protein L11 [Candidatus Aenigmarchaeota archaeon]|nr:50S ribosomal protein L11 [Candidatus Aenigmarchaeota archaeon]